MNQFLKKYSNKKFIAFSSIFLILFGLSLQSLESSGILNLIFACTCKHSHSDLHTPVLSNNESNQLPDCHKQTTKPHGCNCSNGKILDRLNTFLAQFIYLDFPFNLNDIQWNYTYSRLNQVHCFLKILPNEIEKPPIHI